MYPSQILPLHYDLYPERSLLCFFGIVRCVTSIFSLRLTRLQCIPKITLQQQPICRARGCWNLHTFPHRVESVTILIWTAWSMAYLLCSQFSPYSSSRSTLPWIRTPSKLSSRWRYLSSSTMAYVRLHCTMSLLSLNIHTVFLYTTGLILTSLVTTRAFDRDVWHRDIDSSPSPFPIPVLFVFLFPCLATSLSESFPNLAMEANEGIPYCLPGCTCTRKLLPPSGMTQTLTDQPSDIRSQTSGESRPRSLVQLPDEYQRRSRIIVAFEI
jgi:hypothetical protein